MVRCTKCSGSMYLVKDYDGSFLRCLNCGKHLNIHFNKGIPTTKRAGNWGVQPHTKKNL